MNRFWLQDREGNSRFAHVVLLPPAITRVDVTRDVRLELQAVFFRLPLL